MTFHVRTYEHFSRHVRAYTAWIRRVVAEEEENGDLDRLQLLSDKLAIDIKNNMDRPMPEGATEAMRSAKQCIDYRISDLLEKTS